MREGLKGSPEGDSGMTKKNSKLSDSLEVAPVAVLISRGRYVDDHRVPGPDGTRLAIGDRWPKPTTDRRMAATVEVHTNGVKVFLSYRVDLYSDREWQAFAALPSIITVLATPPVAWFLTECHGQHERAPIPLDYDPAEGRMLQTLLAQRQSLDNELTLFCITGDVIKAIKVGLALDGVWRLLAEAVAATPPGLPEQEFYAALGAYGSLDAGVMFAEAMRRQLEPRER